MGRRASSRLQEEANEIGSRARENSIIPRDDGPTFEEIDQHEFHSTRDARVAYLARLHASNLYRSGRTPDELASKWGVSAKMVSLMAGEASRLVRLSIHAEDLAREVMESVAELRELAVQCRRHGDFREAIVANKAKGDLCQTLLVHASELFGSGKALTPAAATKALQEAGWTPPNTLVGLPSPDWLHESESPAIASDEVPRDGTNDSDQNVTNETQQGHG